MTRGTTLNKFVVGGGFVLLAVVGATAGRKTLGFSELPDGRGGTNVEAVAYTPEMGFDKTRSLKAFQATVYPLLRANCSGCHSTEIASSGKSVGGFGSSRHPQHAPEPLLPMVSAISRGTAALYFFGILPEGYFLRTAFMSPSNACANT